MKQSEIRGRLVEIHNPGLRYASSGLQSACKYDTLPIMKTKKLTEVLERVEAWPPHVQNELAEFALELDAEFKDGEYQPTPEELAGIDRGLRAAAEGRFATDQQVEAVFAKFRGR
jgi:hypothetical protein